MRLRLRREREVDAEIVRSDDWSSCVVVPMPSFVDVKHDKHYCSMRSELNLSSTPIGSYISQRGRRQGNRVGIRRPAQSIRRGAA